MAQALALATSAIGSTEPNPRVGCVIGHSAGASAGQVLGQGATQAAGGAHAEAMALRDAHAQGAELRGATAWVSLEPCSHHGRTPPCADALVQAGVSRVVVAVGDPFAQVAGRGIARLLAAGVEVAWADADQAQAAWELNIGFFSRAVRGRPWVRLKMAASLDGRTALSNGVSQWITSEAARADGHHWRRRASAILTGTGTVLADDPQLNVRGIATGQQPLRVVADTRLRTPVNARLLAPPGRTLLLTACTDVARHAAYQHAGVEVAVLPAAAGGVELSALFAHLNARAVNELHVEAGAGLSGALIRGFWVDELLVYLAPRLLGPGRGLVAWPSLDTLEDAAGFRWLETAAMGPDLRLRLLRNDDRFHLHTTLVSSGFTPPPTPE